MRVFFLSVLTSLICQIGNTQHQVTTYCQKCEDFDGSAFRLNEPAAEEEEPDCDGNIPSDAKRYCYGANDYNWFDYYRAQDENGTLSGSDRYPIYVWGHPNGGHTDANFVRNELWNSLKGESIHFISWQSINQFSVNTAPNGEPDISQADNCQVNEANQDLSTIIDLILAHQNFLKVDPDQIFIGGQSRGSVASWQTFHVRGEEIAGGYFTQALPNKAWEFTNGAAYVNKYSPDLILGYKYDMYTVDAHDPANGQVIMDQYANYETMDPDFTANSKMAYSMGDQDGQQYSRLVQFIHGDFGFGGSQVVNLNRYTGDTDAKDALCDLPEPNNCIDMHLDSPSAMISANNVQCSEGMVHVDVDWSEEDEDWEDYFDPLNDENDFCKLRFGKINASGEFVQAPYLIDAETDQMNTHLEIPVDFSCDDDGFLIGIEAKYFINCYETPWSEQAVVTIPQGFCCANNSNQSSALVEDNNPSIFVQGSTVIINSNESQNALIRIFDIRGQLVASRMTHLEKGNVALRTGLSAGIYLVTSVSPLGTTSEKIVIF